MEFTQVIFIVFAILIVAFNFYLPLAYRKYLLLGASVIFISWFSIPSFISVFVISTITFFCSKLAHGNRALYVFGLGLNIVSVFLFNYFTLIKSQIGLQLSSVNFSVAPFILAVGVSFYCIQHIMYLVDIKRGLITAENNYIDFITASVYFPKIISGPIIKTNSLISELKAANPTEENITLGFNRFIWGLFKKLVIADRLAPSVHSIFDYDDKLVALTTILGVIFFTIQLYADFSGYCDMAIGVSKMLGITLPENFNQPFKSTSISEFWRNWHITLIGFFTQYVFTPVNYYFRKSSTLGLIIAIATTFILSGLWHGIGLGFGLWALCHLVYLSAEYFLASKKQPAKVEVKSWVKKFTLQLIVFILVCFTNVFFRSSSIDSIHNMMTNIFSTNFFPTNIYSDLVAPLAQGAQLMEQFNLLVTFMLVVLFLGFETRVFQKFMVGSLNTKFIIGIVLLIAFFGIFNNGERFIYMQF